MHLLLALLTTFASLPALTSAHGHHGASEPDHTGLSWAAIHMLEEHHISTFDAASFFHLHDFDSSLTWTPREMLQTYGITPDVSLSTVPSDKRDDLVRTLLARMDYDGDGAVTLEEFVHFHEEGGELPDFGLGPGHHGDDEYEYEIHHFERFHSEDSPDEELNHPEDIAHFKKHDEMEAEEEKLARLEARKIVLENVPKKYRRGSVSSASA